MGKMAYHTVLDDIALYLLGSAALVIFYRSFFYPYFLSGRRLAPGPTKGELSKELKQFNNEINVHFLRHMVKEYGPIFRLVGAPMIPGPGLVVCTPTAQQRILVSNSINYGQPRLAFFRWVTGGLFTLPEREHRGMRKILDPVFSFRNLISTTGVYYNTVQSLITIFRSKIDGENGAKDGDVILVYEWLARLAIDNVSEAILGFKLDTLHDPNNELITTLDELSRIPTAAFELLVRVPGFLRLVTFDSVRHSTLWQRRVPGRLGVFFTFMRCLSTIRKNALAIKATILQEDSANRDLNVISVLQHMQSSDETANADIAGNIIMLWMSGRATIATRISWLLWLLAKDQQCQQQLRDEIAPLFSRDPRPDYRSLDKLQWLDSVIMESIRLFLFGPNIRVALNDDYIDGVFVPKGTVVVIPLDLFTRGDIWGEDPDQFKPARWLDSTKRYKISPPFLSFLTGPHRCIAKGMAIMQTKIVIASLIANFEFKPAYEGQHVEGNPSIIGHGMPLHVKPIRPS
ncbi:hypothetical protein GALMADRAFT_260690 [Galerina marginata CBS 339.88]|uniref:Cytochrome P450 n=1 Tax=Galerina marginata (strain CBS 339.88) TaxID=685588 RepID=A0A067TPA9_GALM3|nr:hypothetical protein GALMADRAFT_260690 [Galerina marginata CBS 339.88]